MGFFLLTSSNRDESKGCIKMQISNKSVKRSRGALQEAHHHTQTATGVFSSYIHSAAGRSCPSIPPKEAPLQAQPGAEEQRAGDTHTTHIPLASILCGTSEFRGTAANSPPMSGRVDTSIEVCLFTGCRRCLSPPHIITASSA
jgi:hypothetical protein